MGNNTPKQQWENLRLEFLRRVDEIDKQTPWSETEPAWWLLMQDARRAVLSASSPK